MSSVLSDALRRSENIVFLWENASILARSTSEDAVVRGDQHRARVKPSVSSVGKKSGLENFLARQASRELEDRD